MMAPVDDDDGHVPPRLSSALGPATMTMTGSVGTCRQAAHGAATSDIGIGLPNRRDDDNDDDNDDDDDDYGDDGEQSFGEGEEGSRTAWDRAKAFYWRNLGLLLFFLGQTFGSTMNTAAKLLTNNGDNPFHPLHIIFVRMVASTALGFTYTWYRRVPDAPLGPRNIRHLLLIRGLTGFVGLWGTYYSVTYMNLADAICISFLVPTLTAFVSYVWLREPYTPKEALAGVVALGGVVLVARPSFLFPPEITEDGGDGGSGGLMAATPAQRALAVLSAVAGAFGAAVAFTTIRVIGDRAHSLISVNYFALVATVVSTVLIVVHPDIGFALPRGSEQWILLLIIAVSGFMLQFLLTEGLKREKAGRATNMMYLQMVFALVVERVIWGTTPTFVSLLGASLIIGAAIWVSLQKSQATATTAAASRADELHQLQQQKRLAGLEDEENGLLNRRSRDPDSDDDSDDDDNGLRNDLRRQ